MSCSIVRHENGTVAKVLAPNGKESILYKTLTEDLGLAPETALKKWAMTQTRTFRHWFGESQSTDKNGEPLIITNILGEPIYLDALGNAKHATENYGTFTSPDMSPLLKEVQDRYKLVKPNGAAKVFSNTSEVIDSIHKNYPGVNAFVKQTVAGKTIGLAVNDLLSADNI